MRVHTLGSVCLIAGLAAAPGCFAQTYATLSNGTLGSSGSVNGTLGADTLSYSGEVYGLQTSGGQDYGFGSLQVGDQDPWVPTSTFISGTVPNAPSDRALLAISQAGTDTVQFLGTPVSGLIVDVFSLGSGTQEVSLTFNHAFEVLSCGSNMYFGGGCFINPVGSTGWTLSGMEGNGTIEFFGDVSDLTITVSDAEAFSGLDFGSTTSLRGPGPTGPTPEPSSLILLGTGVVGAVGVLRRRIVRK